MFFIQFNDDILIYNLLYNGSYIHKSIKILNFELISSILQIPLSNNFLVYSNPMIFSDKICLDLVSNNIKNSTVSYTTKATMLNLNYWRVVLNIMTAVLLELARMVVGTDSEIINLPCCWCWPVWSYRTLIIHWQTSGEA